MYKHALPTLPQLQLLDRIKRTRTDALSVQCWQDASEPTRRAVDPLLRTWYRIRDGLTSGPIRRISINPAGLMVLAIAEKAGML